jgi:hypothetical protein
MLTESIQLDIRSRQQINGLKFARCRRMPPNSYCRDFLTLQSL